MASTLLVSGTLAIATFSYFLLRNKVDDTLSKSAEANAQTTDPGLLRKHSTIKTYHAAGFTYPSIRTFYSSHPQAAKLPVKPRSLPLLVFVHGLGGSIAQFAPLLTGLVNTAPCLAIDLPGCGLSSYEPETPGAYTSQSLAQLIAAAINEHRDVENEQQIILIGHSMGCSLAVLLASSTSPISQFIKFETAGFVAMCPKAEPPSAQQVSRLQYVHWMPLWLFELYRGYDRRGGTESASVQRYAGKDGDVETKRLQLRFNEQSRSEVFLAMAFGAMPQYSDGNTEGVGGLPGKVVWSGLKVPTFLLGGSADEVCPAANVELIAAWLGRNDSSGHNLANTISGMPAAASEAPLTDLISRWDFTDTTSSDEESEQSKSPEDLKAESRPADGTPKTSKSARFVLKTTVLPKPAAHSLLYATPTVRVLSGLIQSFIATHIDHRLSLGWQLQHLSTSGKWDVKNLRKWQAIQPVSGVIGNVFRAMKTLREVDDSHTPKVFVKDWGAKRGVQYGVRMVVDISHESPVYDPRGLEHGQVEYHKFPTVSKLPPTADEVHDFVALVDALRDQLKKENIENGAVIGVHCHYGFNRTGFFIISYLVERLGYRLQDAIEEFADKRAPGIKHEHFINELYVRYGVNLARRPTICE